MALNELFFNGKTLYVFDSNFEIRMPNMKIKQQNNGKFCHEVDIYRLYTANRFRERKKEKH